jgi:hypothetical protein
LLENFAYYWMFVMLLPEEVGYDFVDLLRMRDNAGPWNSYFVGCGQSLDRVKYFRKHFGKARQYHADG